MTPLLEASGLVKRFRSVTALDGLDVTMPAGQVTALLGPNGAGKTTFIRTVATLLRPDAGQLRVLGHDVARAAPEVRSLIGLAGQSAAVEPTMTGIENLIMVARLYGQSRRASRASAAAVVDRLALGDFAFRAVRTYSGGQRRRLDLAASLVGSPRLLLLDEPTTGLDPRSRAELWEVIRSLAAAGTDVLLCTQYLDEADHLAARIVIIDAGRVVASGTPGELKSRAGEDRVEVRVLRAGDLEPAASLLSSLVSSPASVDTGALRVSVGVASGASVLSAAASGLASASIEVEDLTLRRPTLDEVFMALTQPEEAAA